MGALAACRICYSSCSVLCWVVLVALLLGVFSTEEASKEDDFNPNQEI